MESIDMQPPPLPPKTRQRAPLGPTQTVNPTSAIRPDDVYSYGILADPTSTSPTNGHVVKIRIDPHTTTDGSIRISVNGTERHGMVHHQPNALFYYNGTMSSGQLSPNDSGAGSDLDGHTPPPPGVVKKKGCTTVTVIGAQHKRAASLTSSGADSDDNESSISSDSLNLNTNGHLPATLLQDIRQRATSVYVDEKSYEERRNAEKISDSDLDDTHLFDPDQFYKFHLNENVIEDQNDVDQRKRMVIEDETFAGFKDLLNGDGASTIRSAKGTVRGVRNRVRAGIATFLQINANGKSFKEKDAGKVVVYTTTMGILRETYQACMKVKQILRTLLVKFEERDVFMSNEYQNEIRERMRCEFILVPQVYVDGQHIGDAETIERLNESGELRRIMKPYKSLDACTTCKVCGGYRLLPCQVCNGSKKSVHRNHFTTEFVALKCMNCDEVGLVRCNAC